MIKKVNRNEVRQARHTRVRNTVSGTTDVPRLSTLDNMKDYTSMLPHVCNLSISKTMLTASSKLIATSDDH